MKRVSTNDGVIGSKFKSLLVTLKEGAVKTVLLASATTALCAGVFFGGAITAYAATEFPVGDLREVQPIIEIEADLEQIPEEAAEGNSLSPIPLGASLSTGKHYQYLSSDEKILYAGLYQAVTSKKYVPYLMSGNSSNSYLTSKIYPIYTGSKSFLSRYSSTNEFWVAAYRAAEACYYDHPGMIEIYMVSAKYVATYRTSNGKIATGIVYVSNYDDTQFASIDSQIESRANAIVSVIKSYGATSPWPAYNEWIAHNYYSSIYNLAYDNAAYESGNAAKNAANQFHFAHTAYGSLVLGKAVCDGYSTGFEIILEKLGIPTMCVSGLAGSASSYGGHAWNIVNLDGKWYEVDTTWADVGVSGKILPSFFNQTTATYATGIMGNFHRRVNYNNLVGFRFPQATGTHWTWNYVIAGRAAQNYAHDVTTVGAVIPYGGANYVVTGNNTVAFAGGTSAANVAIPDKIYACGKTFAVTAIKDNALSGNPTVKSVSGGKNVRTIGKKAFNGCKKLSSVKLSSAKITSIGSEAFSKSSKLSKIEINGNKLKKIGKNAFKGIKKKASIKVKASSQSKYQKVVKSLKKAGAKKAKFKKTK